MTTAFGSNTYAHRLFGVLPGFGLCLAVTGGAYLLQNVEQQLFGRAWLEALVLAILLGIVVRSLWTPHERWFPGISFSASFFWSWP